MGDRQPLYPDESGYRHPGAFSGLETHLPVDSPASLIVVCGLCQLGPACTHSCASRFPCAALTNDLLLTDYRVEESDTLAVRSLGQIAEGCGVMPVSRTPEGQTKALMLPKPDRVLPPGDALLVLLSLLGDLRAKALEQLPRLIARWLMIPNQRTTWFSQEA